MSDRQPTKYERIFNVVNEFNEALHDEAQTLLTISDAIANTNADGPQEHWSTAVFTAARRIEDLNDRFFDQIVKVLALREHAA